MTYAYHNSIIYSALITIFAVGAGYAIASTVDTNERQQINTFVDAYRYFLDVFMTEYRWVAPLFLFAIDAFCSKRIEHERKIDAIMSKYSLWSRSRAETILRADETDENDELISNSESNNYLNSIK